MTSVTGRLGIAWLGVLALAAWGQPGPVRLTVTSGNPGTLNLSWNAETGATYNLQWAPTLAPGAWQSLAGLVTGPTNAVTDTLGTSNRFYRVVIIQNLVKVTSADSGNSQSLGPGDILQVTLNANPSTGYTWEVSPPAGTPVVRQIGTPQYVANSPNPGSPGQVTFLFEPVIPGQMTLTLIYHKPWETGVPPAQTFSISVNVRAAQ